MLFCSKHLRLAPTDFQLTNVWAPNDLNSCLLPDGRQIPSAFHKLRVSNTSYWEHQLMAEITLEIFALVA